MDELQNIQYSFKSPVSFWYIFCQDGDKKSYIYILKRLQTSVDVYIIYIIFIYICVFTCIRHSSIRVWIRGISHSADLVDPLGLTRKEENKVTVRDLVGVQGMIW